MACYNPLRAYFGRKRAGKNSIVWTPKESVRGETLNLPCGGCIGCRLDRSRDWAQRCWHEAQLHEDNCFITLTYDPEHMPANGSIDVREFQLFIKKLRFKYGKGIRYFHCGEYGEKLARPHYHALLFGFDFPDKYLWSVRNGNNLYRSQALEELWGKGFCTVGSVTVESAGYVARYVMKKVTGDKAEDHYNGKAPEYITMSRRPGIGHDWYKKFRGDFFPSDQSVVNGSVVKPPRYYANLLDKEDNVMYKELKARRKIKGLQKAWDNDSFRLPVKEVVKKAAIAALSRPLEINS